MRYSKQRESILQTVLESNEHPTANMVYASLKEAFPKLSLGTVYRDLNQLAEAGRLKRIPLPDGSCRYDGTIATHSHIVCQDCGEVADVMVPPLEELKQAVSQETDFTLTTYDLVMRGVCKKCHKSGNTLL